MMKLDTAMVIKLIGSLQGLMDLAIKIPNPEKIHRYITVPPENQTEFFVVTLKAAFKTKQDAENFLEFDKRLDKAFI